MSLKTRDKPAMCWPFAVALFVLLLVQQAACSDRDRLMSDSPLDALAKEAVWTGQGKLRGPMPQGDPNEAVMKDISKELLGLEKPSSSRRGADGSHVGQKFIKIPATYIVQVKGTPAAAAIAERRASTSAASATTHSRVRLMAEAVVAQITSVAAAANVADKVVRKYTHALSGFAVSGPTPNQLRALVADPNVAAIWPNRIYRTNTFTTPEFLGLVSSRGPNPHGGYRMSDGHQGNQAAVKSDNPPNVDNARHASDQQSDSQDAVARVLYRRDKHRDSYDNPGMYQSPERYEQYKQYDTGYQHSPPQEVDQDYYRSEGRRDYNDGDLFDESKHAVWDQLGGVVGPSGAGEDIVIAMLDSGIWIEDQPSFADKHYWADAPYGGVGQSYLPLSSDRWSGICQSPEDGSTQVPCNNKVVGCRHYYAGWATNASSLLEIWPDEAVSCRDVDGHGSHTAATAAGNYGAQPPFTPRGALLSGMAPRARLAIYKVSWGFGEGVTADADIVAATDDAIADGANVISMSLGATTPFGIAGPVEIAHMYAAAAGIFVAASGGNNGPALATVINLAPWTTTVALSMHPRRITSKVKFSSGVEMTGSTAANHGQIGPAPVIYGADAFSTSPARAASCARNSLDPTLVNGKIVVCDSNGLASGSKLSEVARAGGIAAIVGFLPEAAATGDNYPREFLILPSMVPGVFVQPKDRETAIREARTLTNSAQAAATAAISAPIYTYDNTAPRMVGYSGKGPATTMNQLVLKPDITAPGLNIYAAVSPAQEGGFLYNFFSG